MYNHIDNQAWGRVKAPKATWVRLEQVKMKRLYHRPQAGFLAEFKVTDHSLKRRKVLKLTRKIPTPREINTASG